jgi:hypothetical protein
MKHKIGLHSRMAEQKVKSYFRNSQSRKSWRYGSTKPQVQTLVLPRKGKKERKEGRRKKTKMKERKEKKEKERKERKDKKKRKMKKERLRKERGKEGGMEEGQEGRRRRKRKQSSFPVQGSKLGGLQVVSQKSP